MRILWLPHLDWEYVRHGQREYHLIREIKSDHDVHVLTWEPMQRSAGAVLRSLRAWRRRVDGITLHHARRVPNFLGRFGRRTGRGLWINEWLYQRAVRSIVRHEAIDLVICSISHEAVGLPPADLSVPMVFDYLDFDMAGCPDVEAAYLERADVVLCTTRVLVDRVERRHRRCYYLPNGADLELLARAEPSRVRQELGLKNATVVSLIGVHCSDDLFFVDALAMAARHIPNLVFMVVGRVDRRVNRMLERARALDLPVVATGLIPRDQVSDFFAATDVGLFPADRSPYFEACCPLKVLEYTAARKPVVATDLAELRNWSFPNVRLAEPTAEAFAREIEGAASQPHHYPDITRFAWSHLGQQLQEILKTVATSREASMAAVVGGDSRQ